MPPSRSWVCMRCGRQVDRAVTDAPSQCFSGTPGVRKEHNVWADYCCNCFVGGGWERWSYDEKACAHCRARKACSKEHPQTQPAAEAGPDAGAAAGAGAAHIDGELYWKGELWNDGVMAPYHVSATADIYNFCSESTSWKCKLGQVLTAMKVAWNKRTCPLLIDQTLPDGVDAASPLEAFFKYCCHVPGKTTFEVLDLRAAVLEVNVRKTSTWSTVQDHCRSKVVSAMQRGGILIISMSNTCPPLSTLHDQAKFPQALFDSTSVQAVRGKTQEQVALMQEAEKKYICMSYLSRTHSQIAGAHLWPSFLAPFHDEVQQVGDVCVFVCVRASHADAHGRGRTYLHTTIFHRSARASTSRL